jgi:COP9 signalosome complex subunit 7
MHNFYLLGLTSMTGMLDKFDNLLLTIQEKLKWADIMSEVNKHHKKEVEDKAEQIH